MIMSKNIKQNGFERFNSAVFDVVSSKYIMFEKNLAEMLQAVADCKEIYNLIARCMVNFDYSSELKKSNGKPFLVMPEYDEDKLAFLFCLLKDIDDKKIKFSALLERYFSYAQKNDAYGEFCRTVIENFKFLVFKLLQDEGKLKLRPLSKKTVSQNDESFDSGYLQLVMLLGELKTAVGEQKKIKKCQFSKEELSEIIDSFASSARQRQNEQIKAFMVVVKRSLENSKELCGRVREIENFVISLTKE